MNAPFTPNPAFTITADTDCDVSHGGEDYRAYFTLGPQADAPFLLGVIRASDDCPMGRVEAVWLLGEATVLRWEGECPVAEPYSPDAPEQRGYDTARNAS